MPTVDQLLAQLTDAVSYVYRKDATCPGVLFSQLKDGKTYGSIVRYGSQFYKGKQVVCNTEKSSIEDALHSLIEKFLKISQKEPNPLEILRQTLEKDMVKVCLFTYPHSLDKCSNRVHDNNIFCDMHKFAIPAATTQTTKQLQELVSNLPSAPKAGDTVSLSDTFRRLTSSRKNK